MVEKDTMVIRGQFKDGVPVPGEVSMSMIVNVSTKDFPLLLEFGIKPSEKGLCNGENLGVQRSSSSPSCPIFNPSMAINGLAAEPQVVSGF